MDRIWTRITCLISVEGSLRFYFSVSDGGSAEIGLHAHTIKSICMNFRKMLAIIEQRSELAGQDVLNLDQKQNCLIFLFSN
jgi:hypothetical protein